MKVKYSWEGEGESVSPICETEFENKDGISVLSCLLMDDGGIPYVKTIPWIEKGIDRAVAALNGDGASYSWDRESWGAMIAVDGVKIYSLLDENCFEVVSLECFRDALVSWKEFLESAPTPGESKVFE